jgi:glycosyltransferase involved in cell wall biosynthesis
MWLRRAKEPVQLIVSLDADDPSLKQYQAIYPDALINPNKSAVEAVNTAAKHATGNIMIVLSDDTECPPSWDLAIRRAVADRKDYVLKVNDGIQNWIVTMPIIDREYYNRFGYIYHPAYSHMFADTFFSHVADALKRIIWRNDITFRHCHYSVMKRRPDNVNRRADSTWNEGKRTYLRMLRDNLGLPREVNIMRLSRYGTEHLRWIAKNRR